jgi:hypothetical protein
VTKEDNIFVRLVISIDFPGDPWKRSNSTLKIRMTFHLTFMIVEAYELDTRRPTPQNEFRERIYVGHFGNSQNDHQMFRHFCQPIHIVLHKFMFVLDIVVENVGLVEDVDDNKIDELYC